MKRENEPVGNEQEDDNATAEEETAATPPAKESKWCSQQLSSRHPTGAFVDSDSASLCGSIHAPPQLLITYDSNGNMIETRRGDDPLASGGQPPGDVSVWSFEGVSVHTLPSIQNTGESMSTSSAIATPTEISSVTISARSFSSRKRETVASDQTRHRQAPGALSVLGSQSERRRLYAQSSYRLKRLPRSPRQPLPAEAFVNAVVATPVVDAVKRKRRDFRILVCLVISVVAFFSVTVIFSIRYMHSSRDGGAPSNQQPNNQVEDLDPGEGKEGTPTVLDSMSMEPFFSLEIWPMGEFGHEERVVLVDVVTQHIITYMEFVFPALDTLELKVNMREGVLHQNLRARRQLSGDQLGEPTVFAQFNATIQFSSGFRPETSAVSDVLKDAFSGRGIEEVVDDMQRPGRGILSLVVVDADGKLLGSSTVEQIPEEPDRSQTSDAGTVPPTTLPTPAPVPSSSPSAVPTLVPSVMRTEQPTMDPTNVPSFAPSKKVFYQPEGAPTVLRSASPSTLPTTSPTSAHTLFPSRHPTTAPSSAELQEWQTAEGPIGAGPTPAPNPLVFHEPAVLTNKKTFPPTEGVTGTPTLKPSQAPGEHKLSSAPVTTFSVSSVPVPSVRPTLHSLQTVMDGHSLVRGVMFDVTAKRVDIAITSLYVHLISKSEDIDVSIWTKKGSHVGYERDPSVWTVRNNGAPFLVPRGRGYGRFTQVFLEDDPVQVPREQTVAIYMALRKAKKKALAVTQRLQNRLFEDDFVQLFTGTSTKGIFRDPSEVPCVWNGGIRYFSDPDHRMQGE